MTAYRPEIDGLRALAVLAVILFHAAPSLCRGGYVGVDVFFVISGYLITNIIIKELEAGRFSIVHFYERRARRILPALYFVMAICIPVALFLFLPYQIKSFSQAVAAVSVFSSNFLFWKSTDYFRGTGEENPLLHTWSLGVEEQFYIVFPVLLFLIWRFWQKRVFWILFVLGLGSLLWSEWAWRSGQGVGGFYWAQTRAWELLIGSLVALRGTQIQNWNLPVKKWKDVFSMLGILLILYSIFQFTNATPVPGFMGLVPTLGTALILLFADEHTLVGKFFAHSWLVGIGLISYSAYLWHQPILVFTKAKSVEPPSEWMMGCIALCSFGLAYLTWRYIETPFREANRFKRLTIFGYSLLGGVLFFMFGYFGNMTDGYLKYFDNKVKKWNTLVEPGTMAIWLFDNFHKFKGEFQFAGQNKILVLGDSFGQDFLNGLLKNNFFSKSEIRTYYIPVQCQIYFGEKKINEYISPEYYSECAKHKSLAELMPQIAQSDVIFLSSLWQEQIVRLLPETIKNFNLSKRQKLFVIGIKSFGTINPRSLMHLRDEELLQLAAPIDAEILKINHLLELNISNTIFVNQLKILCPNLKQCRQFNGELELISYDGRHLTPEGARYVGKQLFHSDPKLKALLSEGL